MSSIVKIRLLNNRFTFMMLKLTKKIYIDGWFFCYCTTTQVTHRRNFRKFARFPIFRLWVKIEISFQIERFKCSYSHKISITESYLIEIKFLVNKRNHGKNSHDLHGRNPCKNEKKTGVTFGHLL